MERRLRMVLMVAVCLSLMIAQAWAATVQVKGVVKSQAGNPIAAATVIIAIEGNIGYIHQNTVFKETNANGEYSASLTIPVDTYYQVSVLAFRRVHPLYVPGFNCTTGPVSDGVTLTYNFVLKPLLKGALVDGYLHDAKSGHPIITSGVNSREGYNVGPIVRSYSNGYYLRMLDLKSDGVKKVTLQYSDGTSGLRYLKAAKIINMRPGQVRRVDFAIAQDSRNAAYIFGRLINGQTGEPIPYASVYFAATDYFCPLTTAVTTDQFGRFVRDTNVSWLNPTGYVTISTNGYYGSLNGEGDHYFKQSKSIAMPALGKSKEVNFELIPKK
jgi:hypothetical protein